MVYDPVRQQIVLESTDMLSSGISRVSNTYVLAEPYARLDRTKPATHASTNLGCRLCLGRIANRFIRFGGYNVTTTSPVDYFDTWAWDGADWTLLTPASSPAPAPTVRWLMTRLGNRWFCFGGKDDVAFAGYSTRGYLDIPKCDDDASLHRCPSGVQFTFNGQVYSGSQTFQMAPGSYTLSTSFSTSPSRPGRKRPSLPGPTAARKRIRVNVGASNVSITGTFQTQYLLTTSSNPSNGGTVTQTSVTSNGPYYAAGTLVVVFEAPSARL